jgi:3-oxoacid CoA-transferase subunit A
MAEGKESRMFAGREYLLEYGLTSDFALLRGDKSDTFGNTVYKGTSRNFNAVMAAAANVTVMEVNQILQAGQLDPASVVTPAIYVDRVVAIPT